MRFVTVLILVAPALSVPTLAAQAIQGAVGNIPAADNLNFGGSVACRAWSTIDPIINANQIVTIPTCYNNRCLRPYNTNGLFQPGGYICQGENTVAYANDVDHQQFYELIDAQVFGESCNHAAFYAVQGIEADATTLRAPGDFRQIGCPGTAATNCFERADTRNCRPTPLLNTNSSYGPNPHQITSVGGLSPVPVVRVAMPGPGCAPGEARLTWDEPELYSATMKLGVPSPVKGVRLYTNANPCNACPEGELGWMPGAAFPLGAGSAGTCVPVAVDTWFALTVRLAGPNSLNVPPSEVETGRIGGTGFVGANSQCLNRSFTATRISNLSARYIGRGNVNVSFTTGLEGGVQSYFVVRAASPAGPYAPVSPALLPQGDGSSYTFTDRVRPALGRNAYYSIEIVGSDGTSERSGSTSVRLPAAKRKLGTN